MLLFRIHPSQIYNIKDVAAAAAAKEEEEEEETKIYPRIYKAIIRGIVHVSVCATISSLSWNSISRLARRMIWKDRRAVRPA